jgi:glycosyltransferase involved in cell wall biosynthesis
MNYLFVHQSFPAQFLHLSAELARQNTNKVIALATDPQAAAAGVIVRRYSLLRSVATETHPLLRDDELKVLRAEACAAAALQLKREGFVPDIIYAHPGWGEALFLKDVFPNAKLVIYCEYYYNAEGQDVGFDPEEPPLTFAQRCKLRLKNSTNLLSLELADAGISPTQWQRSTYPDWAQKKITVIHDGIDLTRLTFNPAAKLTLSNSTGKQYSFQPGDEMFSYVARNLEPVRGFHVFMRCLPEVLRRNPKAHAIIVGSEMIGYGRAAPNGRSWKDHMLDEIGSELDLNRIHFVGQIPYQSYLDLLSITRVHTYWTVPFVLSWSFLEAASSGLPLLASQTPPVKEFSEALEIDTLPFFSHVDFANMLTERLQSPLPTRKIKHLPHIALPNCLEMQIQFLNSL